MTRKAVWIILGISLALAFMVVVPTTRASDWNQATQLTFDQPFELPGHTVLPAGTYWFQVPSDPALGPDFVQILNADRTEVIATLHTVPAMRSDAPGHTEVTFAEASQKQPVALLKWFYPGRVIGHEFIYSPTEEARISEEQQVTASVQNGTMDQAG